MYMKCFYSHWNSIIISSVLLLSLLCLFLKMWSPNLYSWIIHIQGGIWAQNTDPGWFSLWYVSSSHTCLHVAVRIPVNAHQVRCHTYSIPKPLIFIPAFPILFPFLLSARIFSTTSHLANLFDVVTPARREKQNCPVWQWQWADRKT